MLGLHPILLGAMACPVFFSRSFLLNYHMLRENTMQDCKTKTRNLFNVKHFGNLNNLDHTEIHDSY